MEIDKVKKGDYVYLEYKDGKVKYCTVTNKNIYILVLQDIFTSVYIYVFRDSAKNLYKIIKQIKNIALNVPKEILNAIDKKMDVKYSSKHKEIINTITVPKKYEYVYFNIRSKNFKLMKLYNSSMQNSVFMALNDIEMKKYNEDLIKITFKTETFITMRNRN